MLTVQQGQQQFDGVLRVFLSQPGNTMAPAIGIGAMAARIIAAEA